MTRFLQDVGFGIVTAAILAIAAVGFTLQYAVTNVLNLAYGAIMSIGALAAYAVNQTGASIWLAVAAGAASSAVVSVVLSRAVFEPFRTRGLRSRGGWPGPLGHRVDRLDRGRPPDHRGRRRHRRRNRPAVWRDPRGAAAGSGHRDRRRLLQCVVHGRHGIRYPRPFPRLPA